MGLPARKISGGFARTTTDVFSQEARRELLVPDADSDPAGMWRGLLYAVLLAVPIWVGLYWLLRWLIS
jgi:hypothetical protein